LRRRVDIVRRWKRLPVVGSGREIRIRSGGFEVSGREREGRVVDWGRGDFM
jgi:hypothetical protein